MTQITLTLHFPPGDMPDADTDVLILAEGDEEMQLGGLNCTDPVEWVDAAGATVPRVVAWADMPIVKRQVVVGRIGRDPDLVPLVNGRAVDFRGAWKVPA